MSRQMKCRVSRQTLTAINGDIVVQRKRHQIVIPISNDPPATRSWLFAQGITCELPPTGLLLADPV